MVTSFQASSNILIASNRYFLDHFVGNKLRFTVVDCVNDALAELKVKVVFECSNDPHVT